MHWAAPKSCPGKLAEERVELIDALTGVMAVAGAGGGGDGRGGGGDGDSCNWAGDGRGGGGDGVDGDGTPA